MGCKPTINSVFYREIKNLSLVLTPTSSLPVELKQGTSFFLFLNTTGNETLKVRRVVHFILYGAVETQPTFLLKEHTHLSPSLHAYCEQSLVHFLISLLKSTNLCQTFRELH